LVLLDEADAMTKDAQFALRRGVSVINNLLVPCCNIAVHLLPYIYVLCPSLQSLKSIQGAQGLHSYATMSTKLSLHYNQGALGLDLLHLMAVMLESVFSI